MNNGCQMDRLSTYNFPNTGIDCYYYTASADNALDILRFNHLFGSLPSKVNDPHDLKIQISNLETNPGVKSLGLDGKSIESSINAVLARKEIMDKVYRFVCFADAAKVDNDRQSEIRFWNEYADHFKGVRISFQIDRDFLITPKSEETFCGMISYSGRSTIIDVSNYSGVDDILSQITRKTSFLSDLCYSKSPNWAKEYELRLGSPYSRLKLEMSQLTSREERFFEFSPNKLKMVAVGYGVSDVNLALLKLETQRLGVPLVKANVNVQYETI